MEESIRPFIPMQINSIRSKNDTLEDLKDSFNINRLIVLLLSGSKEEEKKIFKRSNFIQVTDYKIYLDFYIDVP